MNESKDSTLPIFGGIVFASDLISVEEEGHNIIIII